jgi:hypothetical protein
MEEKVERKEALYNNLTVWWGRRGEDVEMLSPLGNTSGCPIVAPIARSQPPYWLMGGYYDSELPLGNRIILGSRLVIRVM